MFIGCSPSYDPRVQVISRALVRALRAGGKDFGILGEEEFCCAHEARRMGEKEMFEGTVEMYKEIFEEADFHYRAWLEDNPGHEGLRRRLAGLLAKAGDREAARRVLEGKPPS